MTRDMTLLSVTRLVAHLWHARPAHSSTETAAAAAVYLATMHETLMSLWKTTPALSALA